jgi:hypothetical protein
VVALEQKPSPNNPLGAKGAGEGGIIPVGGVIANAVAAALSPLGIEPRELPLSPPRLWQLVDERMRSHAGRAGFPDDAGRGGHFLRSDAATREAHRRPP